jgi:hypothetical protein
MENAWLKLKEKIMHEAKKIQAKCPDEVKRFHYGLMTHSEAGKYAMGQYFGHWVHLYSGLITWDYMVSILLGIAMDPYFDFETVKKLFRVFFGDPSFMREYAGLGTFASFLEEIGKNLDDLRTKEEFADLISALKLYIGNLYAWHHYYFPWGIGPVFFRILTEEDIEEIERLKRKSREKVSVKTQNTNFKY